MALRVRRKTDKATSRFVRSSKIDFVGGESRANLRLLGDGSLAVPATIARVGLLEYQDETTGEMFFEYRDPAEVFSQESLDSFKGITLTLLHPDSDVTPDNWRMTTIGHVSDDVRAEGDFVCATLILKDANAIKGAQEKTLREISCGYWADVVEDPGEYQGTPYTFVQKNIFGNHVALGYTDWGRSGPDVRLQIDAKTEGKKPMRYADMIALLDSLLANGTITQEQHDALAAAIVDPDEASEPGEGSAQPAPPADGADAQDKKDAFAKAFAKSFEIRDHARIVMGPKFSMRDKDDRSIMIETIKARDPHFDVRDKSDEYIRARFDMVEAKEDPAVVQTTPFQIVRETSSREDSEETTGNPIMDQQMKKYEERKRGV